MSADDPNASSTDSAAAQPSEAAVASPASEAAPQVREGVETDLQAPQRPLPSSPPPSPSGLRDEVDQGESRIAIVETGYVGDVVFTSVLARSIRRAWPEAELVLVARRGPAALAKGLGFHKSIVFDKRDRDRGLRGVDRVVDKLQAARCRALIVPHRSARSALLAWRSKIFMRIGYGGDRLGLPLSASLARFAFTHRVAFEAQQTFTARLLSLLEPLGLPPSEPRPRYRPGVDSKTHATDLLADKGMGGKTLVALAPGSVWATKRWPARSYAELADALVAADMVPLGLGSRDELPLLKEISDHMRYPEQLVDAFGTTLDQAAELMRRSAVVVGGDSGLLHLGLATGSAGVALFGPTDPAQHDLGPRCRVLTVDLECRPCSAHGQAHCPHKHHHCMRTLSVDEVVEQTLTQAKG